ncbi:hypothetical protein PR048_011767 [Dryococelus australis]|uniref:DNA helicase n=1 Tax=Dryococelus australis TaxID=614101 RepID=A0ABQ9HMG6_9NEOP|nr:hypothetical protein PR048_011767 [Dryococelus australis]
MEVARRQEMFPQAELQRLEQADHQVTCKDESQEETQAREKSKRQSSLRAAEMPEQSQTSFQELKTVNGEEQVTYREACETLGLLEDEKHWDAMIEEAVLCCSQQTLQDICGNRVLMSGVVILLTSDFQQTLPIIYRGTLANEMNTCFKVEVEKLQLIINMRVKLYNNLKSGAYACQLLETGEGHLETDG